MAVVQFSHANGFPAGSYRTFFQALEQHLQSEVRAVERIGMDPRFPVTEGWPHLVDQLQGAIAECPEPPILIGHSLGAILSMMAAYRAPAGVRAVLMIDAPILEPWLAHLFGLAKRLGLDQHISPAKLTRTRRDHWPSREAARAHFAARALFARFDERALLDYINAGLIDCAPDRTEGGVVLAIDRAVETRIYRTIPHTLHRLAARGQPVPFGFLAGTRSREIAQAGYRASQKFAAPHFRWFEGGHLFPMERPVAAAQSIAEMLTRMGVL